MITLHEELALAVLRGDKVAALALADKVIEDANTPALHRGKDYVKARHRKSDSFRVWAWPEFRAFAERLGIDWGGAVRNLTLRFREGSAVQVITESHGVDTTTEVL